MVQTKVVWFRGEGEREVVDAGGTYQGDTDGLLCDNPLFTMRPPPNARLPWNVYYRDSDFLPGRRLARGGIGKSSSERVIVKL